MLARASVWGGVCCDDVRRRGPVVTVEHKVRIANALSALTEQAGMRPEDHFRSERLDRGHGDREYNRYAVNHQATRQIKQLLPSEGKSGGVSNVVRLPRTNGARAMHAASCIMHPGRPSTWGSTTPAS